MVGINMNVEQTSSVLHSNPSEQTLWEPLQPQQQKSVTPRRTPVQTIIYNTIIEGSDLVCRVRSCEHESLAYVLPILESLTNDPAKSVRKTGYGRVPSALVILPIRESSIEVYNDFNVYGSPLQLTACAVYGGAPYGPQENKLRRGVDIIIGTPRRVKDHIEKGNIDLSRIKFCVLDELDEMLRMGFVDDVELILGKVQNVTKVQTLIFSATFPICVKQFCKKFLQVNQKYIDLVAAEIKKPKDSTNVRHIVLPCNSTNHRAQLIPDIIHCYSSGGRTIIFTEKKLSANVIAGLLPDARALHGDIQPSQREITLKGLRSGKFMTLVTVNVAARGLNLNDVQLIIQCEPPRDVEAYIHRFLRTEKAGKCRVAVMLYDPKKSNISRIEREAGVEFEHADVEMITDMTNRYVCDIRQPS